MRRIVTTLAIAALAIDATTPSLKPVAISVLADGNIFVLSRTQLDIVEPEAGTKRTIAIIPVTPQWLDATATGTSSNLRMFLIGRGPNEQLSPIAQYDARGNEVRRWHLATGYPSSIALDPSKQILYVTEMPTPSVHSINLAENHSSAHYLAEVRGAARLSSIAVDANGNLYVADVFSGKIYRMAPPSYHATVLISDLGEPSAVTLAPSGQILYVADRSRRCVWSIRLDTQPLRATKFWASDLRAPAAVGVSANGTVWIGDPIAENVLGITKEGKLIRTFR